jgi:hypothetical protein
VSDVALKDIAWETTKPIRLIGGGIRNVNFDRCAVAGRVLTAAGDPPLEIGSGVEGVTFTQTSTPPAPNGTKTPGQVPPTTPATRGQSSVR